MTKSSWKNISPFQRAEFLSPKDLLQRAATITLIFLLLHFAGLRELTSVLNGTIGSLALGRNLSAFLAIIYILFYLAFVVLVPMLILAGVFLTVWQRCRSKNPLARETATALEKDLQTIGEAGKLSLITPQK